jgi:hypothetical protein
MSFHARGVRGGGECRREPPALGERELEVGRWPLVYENDWCGAFEARAAPPAGKTAG